MLGARLCLELAPNRVVFMLELHNAFDEISGAIVLERMCRAPHLWALVPFIWASSACASDIYLAGNGAEKAIFLSDAGLQQGDPLASAGLCVGIHPEVCALDTELLERPGATRFDVTMGMSQDLPKWCSLRYGASLSECAAVLVST